MAIYITPSDIPSPPREPSEPFTNDIKKMDDSFGALIEQIKVCLVWNERISTVLTSKLDARSFLNLAVSTGVTSPGDHLWH